MIGRTHRFHGYNSLRFVYQHGSVVRGSLSSLKYARNPRRSSYRTAVVVGRKVHKSAVVRNRLRRRIYEAVRACEGQIVQPLDLVFTVFSEQLNELSPTQLNELIHGLLKKAGAFSANDSRPDHGIVRERKRS